MQGSFEAGTAWRRRRALSQREAVRREIWAFVWKRDGRRREMGLGAYPAVKLADGAQARSDCREAVAEGRDPIAERQKEAEPTFGECADQFLASMEGHGGTKSTGRNGA